MTTLTPATTCQICGRPILANTGVIAHHGYQRPGSGWQTASCMGARHLPYEQSCDLIPVAIDAVKQHLAKQEAALANMIANPPATIAYTNGFSRTASKVEAAERPIGFDPLTAYNSYSPRDYRHLFFRRKSEIEQSIQHAMNDLDYLSNRLAAWVAPNAALAAESERAS